MTHSKEGLKTLKIHNKTTKVALLLFRTEKIIPIDQHHYLDLKNTSEFSDSLSVRWLSINQVNNSYWLITTKVKNP